MIRREIFLCDLEQEKNTTEVEPTKIPEDDPCYEFWQEHQLSRRVHLYYIDYSYEPVSNRSCLQQKLGNLGNVRNFLDIKQ